MTAGPAHPTDLANERAGERRHRVLVAGLGNVFLSDDGFGVEVARRLGSVPLPEDVRVEDFGIRSLHLAYELLERRYETAILVDATQRGGAPGTLYLLEPGEGPPEAPIGADAHGMTPSAVLRWLESLGGTPGHVLIVGCEPESLEEEMALTAPVSKAVDRAVELIQELVVRGGSPEARPC